MRNRKKVLIIFAVFLTIFSGQLVQAKTKHRSHSSATIHKKTAPMKHQKAASTPLNTSASPMAMLVSAGHLRNPPTRLAAKPHKSAKKNKLPEKLAQSKKLNRSHANRYRKHAAPVLIQVSQTVKPHKIAPKSMSDWEEPVTTGYDSWREPAKNTGDFADNVVSAYSNSRVDAPETPKNTAVTGKASRQVFLRVVDLVRSLRATRYQMGGNYIDDHRGIYKVDCSGFVNHIFGNTGAGAFEQLKQNRGTSRPASSDYYQFLRSIPGNGVRYGWYRPAGVNQLQPGDIIVYRSRQRSSGHMMIVMGKPEQDPDQSDVYHVRISDSANSGHSADTRGHGSGIGVGTLLLRVKSLTGSPYQVAWKEGARWEQNMDIVLGRVLR